MRVIQLMFCIMVIQCYFKYEMHHGHSVQLIISYSVVERQVEQLSVVLRVHRLQVFYLLIFYIDQFIFRGFVFQMNRSELLAI